VPQTVHRRMMHLGAFVHETGQHVAAWRHPDAHAHSGASFAQAVEVAQTAERGKFDLLFLADTAAVSLSGNAESRGRMGKVVKFEPMTILSALAVVTRHLGLVATSTTTYNEPYTLARQFASLDQISGGRAGWNLVTSNNEGDALNYSREEHLAHADRYDRAIEFAEVVNGLWDSWDEDAFIRDKESGVFYDPAKMHVLNHKGKHFSVRGPLNAAPSPQGRPVLVQAGASGTGRDVAARLAELVFTAQTTFEQSKEFYGDVMARLPRFGRTPDQVKVMPGMYPVVAPTESEAKEKFDYLQSLIHPSVGLAVLEHTIGVHGLDKYPLHGPVPEMGDTNGPLSRQRLLLEAARRDNLTLWELCLLNAGPRGHLLTIGTPSQVADVMEHWFKNGAADGFNVMPAWLPGSLTDFVDLVIPELQRRGLFRTEYEGTTLRENLGLPRPASRYATSSVGSEAAQ
jgi:FMN-dependent oxidoreductase (nitrilotriacetate monooxygenase family)